MYEDFKDTGMRSKNSGMENKDPGMKNKDRGMTRKDPGMTTLRSRADDQDNPWHRDNRTWIEKLLVPAMPMPMAIVCCILNFLLPGFGTILAGFSLFCCAKYENFKADSKVGGCCMCFGIGLLQLLSVAFLLAGWIWSCIWGVLFIGISIQFYKRPNRLPSHFEAVQPASEVHTSCERMQNLPRYQRQQAFTHGCQPELHVDNSGRGGTCGTSGGFAISSIQVVPMPPQSMPEPPPYSEVEPPPLAYPVSAWEGKK